MSCLFVRLQKVHVHVDVCHYVFDFVHVSVHCLPFVWMFVIPFSQCLHCLLCMSMCMCPYRSCVVYVYVDVYLFFFVGGRAENLSD